MFRGLAERSQAEAGQSLLDLEPVFAVGVDVLVAGRGQAGNVCLIHRPAFGSKLVDHGGHVHRVPVHYRVGDQVQAPRLVPQLLFLPLAERSLVREQQELPQAVEGLTLVELGVNSPPEFLKGIAQESGARRVHLIAHSMGNLVMTQALAQLVEDRDETGMPEFDQILLTAPDIDAGLFQNRIAPLLLKSGRRLTLYASTNDWALVASNSFRLGEVRLGEDIPRAVGLAGIEAVDASSIDTSFLGHSYFGEKPDVIRDIAAVFRGEPRERRKLFRWGPSREYWAFNALPPGASLPTPRTVPPWAIALGATAPTAIVSFLLGRYSRRRGRSVGRPPAS